MLELSGSALRNLRGGGWDDMRTVAELVPDVAWVKACRVDLAVTAQDPRPSPAALIEAVTSGRAVYRWRAQDRRLYPFAQRGGLAGEGLSVDCGSRKSATYGRVYDKADERLGAGEEVDGPLYRWELECKKDAAVRALRAVREWGVPDAVAAHWQRQCRVTAAPVVDGHESEAVNVGWYQELMETDRELDPMPSERDAGHEAARKRGWSRQMRRTIAAARLAWGDRWPEYLEDADAQLTPAMRKKMERGAIRDAEPD